MTAFIEIELEVGKPTPRGARYNVLHDGDVLLENSRNPEHDAARELLKLGAHADDMMLTRWRGSTIESMRGRVGWFADRTVSEGQGGGVRFTTWAPYTGPKQEEEGDEI